MKKRVLIVEDYEDTRILLKFMLEKLGYSVIEASGPYDAIIVAVGHQEYCELDESYFLSISTPGAVFTDVKGIFRNKISKLNYWSL